MFANGEAGQLSAAEDLDAVTHEYTHGIVGNRLGLINVNGPVDGAPSLNEGFADWGATVSNVYIQGFPSPATWQIGAQDPAHPLDGLRNLQFPISEDLFARDWFPSRTEALGAASRYRNSTIMGHAFYLLASSGPAQHYRAGIPGSGVPVIPVAGLGYEAARNIFYYSMFTGVLNNTATSHCEAQLSPRRYQHNKRLCNRHGRRWASVTTALRRRKPRRFKFGRHTAWGNTRSHGTPCRERRPTTDRPLQWCSVGDSPKQLPTATSTSASRTFRRTLVIGGSGCAHATVVGVADGALKA
jgi:hypothetical protein